MNFSPSRRMEKTNDHQSDVTIMLLSDADLVLSVLFDDTFGSAFVAPY